MALLSGSSNFAPLLHNITPDRVIFCYRKGDEESFEVAEYYSNKRNVPPENLVALPCSNDLYISELQYQQQIERPLLDYLISRGENLSSSGQRELWVIILGYNVPIAFYDSESAYDDPYSSGNLIAISSRLHRLGRERENQFPNPTYDRKSFKFFDSDDSDQVYITAVINGPNKTVAKNLIDRSLIVDNLTSVSGKIHVDAYGKKETDAQLQYQEDILDFINNELSNLGLLSVQTKPTLTKTDPFLTKMDRDCFYFGWFTPRYSKNLFTNQNEKRVFLYNADDDSAAFLKQELSNNSSDPWCNLAINIEPGYATTAGAVSSPDENSYLRPRPFFETLHHGATIGEAFLFASPCVDWKIIFIGDPLLVVNFPTSLPDTQNPNSTLISNNECIRRIKENIEESLAYGYRQSRLLDDVVNKVVQTTDIKEALNLLVPCKNWRDLKNNSSYHDLLNKTVDVFLKYILDTEGLTFNQWLINNTEKTTQLLNNLLSSSIAQGSVDENLLYSEGEWFFEFKYEHVRNVLENLHFQIQLSSFSNFNELIIDENSYSEIDGWKREVEVDTFIPMIESGLPSNFSGRRLRFYANKSYQLLTRTELYYVRWRSLDRNGMAISDWNSPDKPIIIKS